MRDGVGNIRCIERGLAAPRASQVVAARAEFATRPAGSRSWAAIMLGAIMLPFRQRRRHRANLLHRPASRAHRPNLSTCAGWRAVIWVYGFMGTPATMKTTVEVPDDLYRRAKAEAALRGRKFKDLVEEGLRRVLDAPPEAHRRQRLAALMKRARGPVDSGVPDLASNPEHLTIFGRDAQRHR
jgi:hypothetical protein